MATPKPPTTPASPTPSAHAALFDAVYAVPHSDAPREQLAHALRDAGDPRGEFIALQLARARGETLSKEQDKRERALLKAHGEAWLGLFAPLVRKPDCLFERGFPSVLWFKTVTTAAQIAAFEAILAAPEWATVRKTESLLKLSGTMRSLEDAGLSIDALREAVHARLHEVVPLTRLRVVNLGVATREDLEVVRSFRRLQVLHTPYRGDVGFADLLDAPWPALEALGTGEFLRDFPLWLERRGTSRLRTVCFGHPEFQLRLDGRRAHVSHVRQLLDGDLPKFLAMVLAAGVDHVTADPKSASVLAPLVRSHGVEVVAVEEADSRG